MDIADKLIKKLLADYKGPEDLIGANGLMKRLAKKLVDSAMSAEISGAVAALGTTGQVG